MTTESFIPAVVLSVTADRFIWAVWLVQFQTRFEKACPIPPIAGPELPAVVYPVNSHIEPAAQVAVGTVPAVVVNACWYLPLTVIVPVTTPELAFL